MEHFLRKIVETSNQAVALLNQNLEYVSVNHHYHSLLTKITGSIPEIGNSVHNNDDSIHPYLNHLFVNVGDVISKGDFRTDFDTSNETHSNQKSITTHYSLIDIKTEKFIVVFINIVENKPDNQLSDTKILEFFDAFSKGTNDNIYVLKAVLDENHEAKDFIVSYANDKAIAEAKETSQIELTGISIIEYFSKFIDKKYINKIFEVYKTKTPVELEICITSLFNKKYWYKKQIIPLAEGVIIFLSDLTLAKEKELELEKKSKELEQLLENQSDLIVRSNQDDIIYCNDSYLKYFDVTFEEVQGRGYLKFIPEEYHQKLHDCISSLTPEKNSCLIVHPVVLKDGTTKWIEWKDNGIFDTDGNLIETQSIGRDITEAKLADFKLIESEKRWKFALEGMGDGLWDWNVKTDNCNYTDNALDIMGYEKNLEITTKLWEDRIHKDDKERVLNTLYNYINGNSNIFNCEYRFKKYNGNVIWILDRAKIIEEDEEGKPLRLIGTIKDITSRKELESVIVNNNQFLQSILDANPNPMYITNKMGQYLFVSNTFCKLFDLNKEELIQGTEYLHFNSIDSKLLHELNNKALENEDVKFIYKYKKDDSTIYYNLRKTKIYSDPHDPLIITSLSDITKEINKESDLENTLHAKDRFFSILAHDLKNPISGFMAALEILNNDIRLFSISEINTFISELVDNAKNLYELLENLLDWSRLQLNQTDMNPSNNNLRQLVGMVYGVAELNAKAKSIELINSVAHETEFFADLNAVNTVIRNLVFNAIKFTPKNGEIKISSVENEAEIVVCVADNGMGMKDEIKAKLFKIDEKVTTLGTESEKGTGLGLVLCRELINKSGGQIWVESKLGEGSQFYFSIPKALVNSENY